MTSDPSSTNHGGVAAIVSRNLSWKRISPPLKHATFESMCFSVTGSSNTVVVLLIYRPSSILVTDVFFQELSRYLEVIALYKCQVIAVDDLNIHVERETADRQAVNLQDSLAGFDCVQHVPHTPRDTPNWRHA